MTIISFNLLPSRCIRIEIGPKRLKKDWSNGVQSQFLQMSNFQLINFEFLILPIIEIIQSILKALQLYLCAVMDPKCVFSAYSFIQIKIYFSVHKQIVQVLFSNLMKIFNLHQYAIYKDLITNYLNSQSCYDIFSSVNQLSKSDLLMIKSL